MLYDSLSNSGDLDECKNNHPKVWRTDGLSRPNREEAKHGCVLGEGWRDDEVKPGLTHDDALAGAPEASHDGFAVPGFVD